MATTDELTAKAREVLEAGSDKAKEILSSSEKVNELIASARASLEGGKQKIGGLKLSAKAGLDASEAAREAMDNLVLLLDMLEDYINGSYTAIPKNSIVSIVVAICYWVTPFDLINDALPGVGLLDDAAVLALCIAYMSEDIRAYKEWKRSGDELKEDDAPNALVAPE